MFADSITIRKKTVNDLKRCLHAGNMGQWRTFKTCSWVIGVGIGEINTW